MQLFLATFAIISLTVINSCKKSSTNTCSSGLLCANVDGNNYTADPYNSSTGFFGNSTYNGSYAQMVGSGTNTGGYYMKVYGNNGLPGSNATWQIDFMITQLPANGGTYSTQAGSASFEYFTGTGGNQEQYVTDASHSGTVTISSIDTINNLISGTFSYTATETAGQNYTPTQHLITAGSFTNVIIRR